MVKAKFWTEERKLDALSSIAAQDILPEQLGKIDPKKPPSWLTDAAAAVGAGATASGLDYLLRQEGGMRDAVLGGRSALLRKMVELSELIDEQSAAPQPSPESRDELIHDLLRLVRNNGFLEPNPLRPNPFPRTPFRSQLLSALASLAQPPRVHSPPVSLAPPLAIASAPQDKADGISALRLAVKTKDASVRLAQREIRSLKQELANQSRLSESTSHAAEVLGKSNFNRLLTAVGCGRSSKVFNELLIAAGIRWGDEQVGQIRWEVHCPVLLRCFLVAFHLGSGRAALAHLQLSIPVPCESTFRNHTPKEGSHGILVAQIKLFAEAAARFSEADQPALATVSMDGTDVQMNLGRSPRNEFSGDANPDERFTRELQSTELRLLGVARAIASRTGCATANGVNTVSSWLAPIVGFLNQRFLPLATESLANAERRVLAKEAQYRQRNLAKQKSDLEAHGQQAYQLRLETDSARGLRSAVLAVRQFIHMCEPVFGSESLPTPDHLLLLAKNAISVTEDAIDQMRIPCGSLFLVLLQDVSNVGNVGIAGLFLLEKGQSPAELRAIVHAVAAEVHRVSNETVRLVGCATDGEHNSLGLADEGQAPRSIADIHASNLQSLPQHLNAAFDDWTRHESSLRTQ